MQPKLNILLSVFANFEHIQPVISELEKHGHNVIWYPDGIKINRKNLNFIWRGIRSLCSYSLLGDISFIKNIYQKKEESFYKQFIKENKKKIDVLFAFGSPPTETFLKIIKKEFSSKVIVFLWDDLNYIRKRKVVLLQDCDEIFTYSKIDADQHDFTFRPSYYMPEYEYNNEPKDIDIYYKGAFKEKNRFEILKAIDEITSGFKNELSLFVNKKTDKIISDCNGIKNYNKYCDNHFISASDLALKYKRSKVLLDISYKDQKGLGLRPIEAIGANCKLITTNEEIKTYPFYNENIFILDKNLTNLSQIPEFISKPFMPFDEKTKNTYRVESFLSDIGLIKR